MEGISFSQSVFLRLLANLRFRDVLSLKISKIVLDKIIAHLP